jgi:aminoglycoside phosphotransferase (APT) family kinase protein
MGRPALILAALAADAAPGKNFRGLRKLDLSDNLDAVMLQTGEGEDFTFKIPANPQGEGELAVERTVLRALTASASQLPFAIASELGVTKDSTGSLGVLFTSVNGSEPDLTKLPPGAFSKTLADALAAIHSLDINVVKEAGLPEYDSSSQLHQRVAELDRIAALGRVPAALLSRWEAALEDVGMFRYHPTVIHGGLSKEHLKLDGQRLVGMTGFENLRISDPAEDLSWIVGAGLPSTVEDALLHYRAAKPSADENLIQRATLYSELELGSWLAHCIEQGDEEAIAQAEDLISELRDQLEAGSLKTLRAASFVGLVAGATILPEITNSMPVIAEAESFESVSLEAESVDEQFLEDEVFAERSDEEPATETLDVSSIFDSAEKKSEPNSDELF